MTTPNFNCFGFIIDTDSYAGNFERDMCAFLTGHTGDCGVGQDLVDPDADYSLFNEDEEIIVQVPDDHGTMRPTSMYPTPQPDGKREYNSVVIFFAERPTTEQIEFMKEKSKSFNDAYIANDGFYSKYPETYKPVTITGFRVVEFELKEKELDSINV